MRLPMRAENRERRGGSNLIGGSCFRWWSLGVFAMVFSFSLKLKLQVQDMDLVTANGWRRYVLKWQFLQHGKLVDKENRPKEGLVTTGVTSGASTQDKKRCYEAGNLWMDWSITSCHCAQLQQKNRGSS
ncbi:hypothetical protein C5167_042507 [Papaver somniferum]|uniref:Uncharacterized protein n=1 Tax=Papaver somniferum TaxID=3469 RepID=A0A4Y7L5M7_PAPSO|nr:hypothetical protein C5167_042507 [Papaver somniferum]